jgi:hypothetical protein
MRQITAFRLHPNDACPIVVLPEPKEAGNMQKQADLELHRLDQILWRARKRLEWMNRSVLDAAALKAAKDFATRRVKTLPFIRASREAHDSVVRCSTGFTIRDPLPHPTPHS